MPTACMSWEFRRRGRESISHPLGNVLPTLAENRAWRSLEDVTRRERTRGATQTVVRERPPPLGVQLRLHLDGESSTHRLAKGRCVVGAGGDADLVVADAAVSRRHVMLTLVPEGVAVEDLGSRNGTFYLGQRIEKAVLSVGSHITVGGAQVAIEPDPRALDDVEVGSEPGYGGLVGASPPMRRLFATLARLEGSLVPVLVQGPSGVGKELVAKAIHAGSQRSDGPLVVVNCGAISRELVLSELFGHQKGAFTGATTSRPGAFEAADGGTLFLDEVGELPLDVQPALLRALESGEVKPIGDDRARRVDVRVVAATNRKLDEAIDDGSFREDLYFRLAVVTLHVPSLSERPDDVPLLAQHFAGQGGGTLPDDVLTRLRGRRWRGNARELRNAVRAYLAIGQVPDGPAGDLLTTALRHTIDPMGAYQAQKDLIIHQFSQVYFEMLMAAAEGNLSEAARRSGIDRSYLRKLLQKYEVQS